MVSSLLHKFQVRKRPGAISSRRFWVSSILLLLFFALLVTRLIQIQIVDPVPFRLNDCRVETVPGKETLR
jgi:hypothetical protein